MDYDQIANAAAALQAAGWTPDDAGRIAHAYGLDICAAMEDFNND